jgi:hypothetical protein
MPSIHCTSIVDICTQLSQRHQPKACLLTVFLCVLLLTPCCRLVAREKSITRSTPEDFPCDYDTDAIVVHMGGFSVIAPSSAAAAAAAAAANATTPRPHWTSEESSPSAEEDDSFCGDVPQAAAAAVQGKARQAGRGRGSPEHSREQVLQLQLYSIAAPKMRRLPQHTSDLQALGWCQPVRQKQGWRQVQKDYFQAPGERIQCVSIGDTLQHACKELEVLSYCDVQTRVVGARAATIHASTYSCSVEF